MYFRGVFLAFILLVIYLYKERKKEMNSMNRTISRLLNKIISLVIK